MKHDSWCGRQSMLLWNLIFAISRIQLSLTWLTAVNFCLYYKILDIKVHTVCSKIVIIFSFFLSFSCLFVSFLYTEQDIEATWQNCQYIRNVFVISNISHKQQGFPWSSNHTDSPKNTNFDPPLFPFWFTNLFRGHNQHSTTVRKYKNVAFWNGNGLALCSK